MGISTMYIVSCYICDANVYIRICNFSLIFPHHENNLCWWND